MSYFGKHCCRPDDFINGKLNKSSQQLSSGQTQSGFLRGSGELSRPADSLCRVTPAPRQCFPLLALSPSPRVNLLYRRSQPSNRLLELIWSTSSSSFIPSFSFSPHAISSSKDVWLIKRPRVSQGKKSVTVKDRRTEENYPLLSVMQAWSDMIHLISDAFLTVDEKGNKV